MCIKLTQSMNFSSKCMYIFLYIGAILIVSKCYGAPQTVDVKEETPTLVEDGRSIGDIPDYVLSNCACVDTSKCKTSPKQTDLITEPCSNPGEMCCLTDDIDTSALLNLLEGTTPDTKNQPDSEIDNCACLTEVDCINLQGEVSSFGTKVSQCPDSSYICCILNITDVELLIGIEPITEDVINTTSTCKCVPEKRCSDDVPITINVRTSATSSVCKNNQEICCEETNIIDGKILPTGGETKSEDCKCVSRAECSDLFDPSPFTNIQIIDCPNTLDVCCHLSKLLNTSSIIEIVPKTTEKMKDCQCVPSNKCKQISINLSFIVDVRSKTCADPSSVCCFPEDISSPTEEVEPEFNCTCTARALCNDTSFLPDSISTAARCVQTEVCCQNPKIFEHSLSCGQSHESNARIDIRISLGFQAKFAEFPWMVAIFELKDGKEVYRCGGSLITPSVVLTTAYCIYRVSEKSIIVRAGDWDIESTVEEFPFVKKTVASKNIHPSFSARSLEFNVGLLYLDSNIRFQHHINTICLPKSKDFVEYERSCVASGWGKNEFGNIGRFQTTLKKLSLPIIDSNECQESLRKTHLGASFHLDSTVICAGGSRTDACTGDGGSPLICLMNDGSNRFMQAGIVSWGIGCGDQDVPGVYASTFAAIDWIRKVISEDFGVDAVKYFT